MMKDSHSQCLSRSSLCNPHHVPATQGRRKTLGLDCCGLLEILLHQHIHHVLCQENEGDNQQKAVQMF